MSTRNLDKLFDPKSIAVIGASNTKGSVGYILLRNLIGARVRGRRLPGQPHGAVDPGHPGLPEHRPRCPHKVDLAIIAVPAKIVLDVVRECGEAGVVGRRHRHGRLQRDRRRRQEARRAGGQPPPSRTACACVGPNCLGYVRPGLQPQRHLRRHHARSRPRGLHQPVGRPGHRRARLGHAPTRSASRPSCRWAPCATSTSAT